MTAATDRDPGKEKEFCTYGARYLLRLLPAFSGEIAGVREGGNIEPVHRMRVASRRLRAALPLFSSCMPEKKYKAWFREVRGTTRALGSARDLDVQIEFLEHYRNTHTAGKASPGNTVSSQISGNGSGLDHLIDLLRTERSSIQPKVQTRLDELEECRVVEKMRDFLEIRVKTPGKLGKKNTLYSTAYREITQHLDALLAFEPWVYEADAAEEQHLMRIAAKKLRYTMEIFAPLYGTDLRYPLRAVKSVQELLGAIHDCDVWIQTLPDFMREESKPVRGANSPGASQLTIPDIAGLLEDRKRARNDLYEKFVAYWKSIRLEGVLEEIPLLLSRYRDP
jgi:CHAD domain-containing protein